MTAPEGWPPDPTEEDVERLRPSVAWYAALLGPALVEEARKAGGVPTIGSMISAIVESVERSAFLQELGLDSIDPRDALLIASRTRIETRAMLGDGEGRGE